MPEQNHLPALHPEKSLRDLLAALPEPVGGPVPDLRVTGVSFDSRRVEPGDVFVALAGGSVDGHRFIPDAIRGGASAVVGTQPLSGLSRPYFQVPDGRRALAYLSAALYNFPARRLTVVGVTGTDGKTTTANLIYRVLRSAGVRTGMISTVNALIGDEVLDTGFHVTTPEAPAVQAYLARMVRAGLTHVVLEATSHGLAQHRVTACEFDVGVVTNITHEHLDYHGDYESYREAKARLFTSLFDTPPKPGGSPRAAVLNRADESFPYLESILEAGNRSRKPDQTPVEILTYALEGAADFRAEEVSFDMEGSRFTSAGRTAEGEIFRLPLRVNLPGAYNVSNSLAALAVTVGILGVAPADAGEGIERFEGVPGRMERIDLGQPFLAIVDFAHTPNALRRALETAREIAGGGRVIAVFGSAGLRDRQKRRMMAETSAQLADLTVLTAEDPRTEPLDAILLEMAHGAEQAGGVEGRTFWRIPDRGEALRFAVRLAKMGDILISCGKGHEQSMCFGEREYSWDDRIALRAALAEHLGQDGPSMPYLPTQDR